MKILFLTLFFTSCSFFIKSIDGQEEKVFLKEKKPVLYCDYQGHSVFSKNLKAAEIFRSLIDREVNLNFLEKSIMWSLAQMSFAPHQASPSSRLQILLRWDNKIHYYDFNSGDLPYLYGLYELGRIGKTKELYSLAKLLDRKFPKKIAIGKDFAQFLNNHSGQLQSPYFKNHFFKADEPLRYGETLERFSFVDIIKLNKRTKVNGRNNLIKQQSFQCSEDLNNNIIYSSPFDAHTFSISDKNGNFFLASSSSNFKAISPYKKTYLIQAGPGLASSFCFKNEGNINEAFISSSSRSPNEILRTFISKNQTDDHHDIEKTLILPRKLTLENPNRVLIESNELRNPKGPPHYYYPQIGEILAYLKTPHFQGYIKDPRTKEELVCPSRK